MLAITLAFLSGCGGDSSSSRNEMVSDGLGGTWVSKCGFNSDKNESAVRTLKITKTGYSFHTKFFRNNFCETDKAIESVRYSYLNVKKIDADLEGWSTFSYFVEDVQIKLENKSAVKSFNANRRFGLDNWKKDSWVSVQGKKYRGNGKPMLKKGDLRITTMKLENDQLSLAKYEAGKALRTQKKLFNFKKQK